MYPISSFQISDETYNDNIRTHSLHYNSMRAKPIYPIGLIETNISSVKPFSNNWFKSTEESAHSPNYRHFAKRTLFNANEIDRNIHLASISSLTNQHLLDPEIKFPDEDHVSKEMGMKRKISDKRNEIGEKSRGDKTYKNPEYSKDFYYKTMRNWRSEKYDLPKRREDILENDLINALKIKTPSNLFNNKTDFGYEFDKKKEKIDDIQNVLSLTMWKSAPKLELPFKVLDLPEKALKYRPRVTR